MYEEAYDEYRKNNYTKVQKIVTDIIKKDPNFEKAYSLKILTLSILKKNEEAHIECNKALKKFKKSNRFNRVKGVIYFQSNNNKLAEKYFKRAIVFNKKDDLSYYYLSLTNERKNNMKNAQKYMKKAISLFPKDPLFHSNLGRMLLKENKVDESIISFKQAIKLDQKNSIVLNLMSIALELKGETKEAEKYLEKMLKMEPKNEEGLFSKASMLYQLKKYTEALKILEKVIKINPQDSDFWIKKGEVLNALKKYNEAIICFNEALRLNQNNLRALIGKSKSYTELNCLRESNNNLNKYIKKNSKDGIVWMMKAINHAFLKEVREAEHCFRNGLKHSAYLPNQTIIMANLILGKKENAKKALVLINKDLKTKITPKSLIDKGDALLILKKPKEAITVIKQAIEIKFDEANSWYTLGEAYAIEGNQEKSINALKIAISLNPKYKKEIQKDTNLKILKNNKKFKLLQK